MLIAHTRLPFLHSSNEEGMMSIVFDKALKSQSPLESRLAPSDAHHFADFWARAGCRDFWLLRTAANRTGQRFRHVTYPFRALSVGLSFKRL